MQKCRCFMFIVRLSFYTCCHLFSRFPTSNSVRQQSHYSDASNLNSSCNNFFFLQHKHIHEACNNINAISFPRNLLCVRIVEYKYLCSHYSRQQLLFEPALTELLFKETTGDLCGPEWPGQNGEILQPGLSVDLNRVGAIFSAPLQNCLQDNMASYTKGNTLFPGVIRPLRCDE